MIIHHGVQLKEIFFLTDMDLQDIENDEEAASYVEMERRDKRRWEKADEDNDGALNREEFTNFLHPEESSGMRDIVVLETLEDVDKDKDGKISVDEYIGKLILTSFFIPIF